MKKNNSIYFAKGFAVKKSKIIFLLLTVLGGLLHQATAQTSRQNHYDTCWEGTLGEHIPILLHYHQEHDITEGEIVYRNTQAKQPIPVIGSGHYADGRFSLNEYSKEGHITGMLSVTQKNDSLVGRWYLPYAEKEFALRLVRKDTLIPAKPLAADPSKITGDYFYQYGEKGPQGEWKVQRVGQDSLAINAWSVTHAPARNIAEIEDTVALTGTHFIYKINMEESWMDKPCKIVMKGQFYKNFLRVTYINENPCAFYFGHNATLEGVYYKIKNH